jgi:hypothetical protein
MIAATDEIGARLHQLNLRFGHPLVRAFLVWHDVDLDDDVAEVLYGLPAPANGRWDTAELDRYCEAVSEAIKGVVAYSYCDFRTGSEASDVLESQSENWTPVRPLTNA